MNFQKFFFDFDGTIVNSELVGRDAEVELLETFGVLVEPKEFASKYQHLSFDEFLGVLETLTGRKIVWQELLTNAYEQAWEKSLRPQPGIEDLLEELNGCFLITTNTSRRSLLKKMEFAGLPSKWAAGAITGNDVQFRKPHPETYLRALERLSVTPGKALAFEDSSIGVTAASTAGIPVIGYPGGLEDPSALLEAGAVYVLNAWDEALDHHAQDWKEVHANMGANSSFTVKKSYD